MKYRVFHCSHNQTSLIELLYQFKGMEPLQDLSAQRRRITKRGTRHSCGQDPVSKRNATVWAISVQIGRHLSHENSRQSLILQTGVLRADDVSNPGNSLKIRQSNAAFQ